MKEIQTIKRRRLTVLTVITRRQNLLKKEIPLPYSAEKKDNLSDMTFEH
jgi:hypothetical protein